MNFLQAAESIRAVHTHETARSAFEANAALYEEMIQRVRLASPLDTIETIRGLLHMVYMFGTTQGGVYERTHVDGTPGDIEQRRVIELLLRDWEEDTNA